MKPLTPLFFTIIILVFAGCTTYPMGLTKAQWNALSSKQQQEYANKQVKLDEQRAQAREARWQEYKQQKEERERQANERVTTIQANPKYGDIIEVRIEGGEIGIGNRYQYQPVQFELARGEYKGIVFKRQDKPSSFRVIQVQLSEDGNTFFFDPGMNGIRISNDGWQSGRTYYPKEVRDISVGSGAKDIRVNIRFKDVTNQSP